MAKYYATATRDFSRTITMGALVIQGLRTGDEREIAPPRVHVLECKAGTVSVHRTKRDRDAYLVAINQENPGAVIAS